MRSQNPAGKDIPPPQRPTPHEAVKTEKERAEATEVAGRHKNTGQKDHKGAR